MFYNHLIKPILFHLDPESAHHLAATFLSLSQKIPFFHKTLSSILEYKSKRLEQTIQGIHFPNPLGLAAGFDKTAELFPTMIHMGFGFIEVGTITAKGQPGNDKPRLFRYPKHKALINRMGFNNPGADIAESNIKKQKKTGVRGINAGKSKVTELENAVGDYVYTLQKLVPYGDYAVINISSPNTPGLRSLQTKKTLIDLIEGIQSAFNNKFPIPLYLKFAPDLTEEELIENLKVCLDYKINGVILTNTTLNKDVLGEKNPEEGGLSGGPLFDRSLHFVTLAYKTLQGKIPIIGVGGIDSGEKAKRMMEAGANLIQIYTGYIYEGPFLPYQICSYLDKVAKEKKLNSISELVGSGNK
ncbi:quinone-dependent dihydroorotate dehydrogenase [Leptospira sp. 2 VSF19]|uniref:Dihydroorotate dehydrogenase (quinone) n=1 Tax=Leptospira soteropolitanensis TaxID=2950025 RepID=A0AAW5V8D6_9LEPT|nr:quinone-dependent dihydroorotate dehydrogenase [Leptospira soteropolitanensis]MCW7491639.1 quinone-dependent dihydroorotate dehydrogenase [Leptospira soteropolitanensis]MCW7499223.1 quinone-dependent dihydroorotate dehydrogenase [Leptospira soteropolitanensis]MCW7521185.1 quinone-dependent dihydroorotate dehydrogenase [Leptospira soteropolitanensis]MCW7525327.1 quinone-dependent dihydroorotate dehydrogenase [Leptospira soteropolitanensis]MCW7529194.1 quinone-dependent dihydroorotate dehydro